VINGWLGELFMRSLCFFILICLFSVPVMASDEDEAVLPFAYVTLATTAETTWANYDVHVMDALSGTILYELATERHDCVTIFAQETGTWLLQSQSSEQANTNSDYVMLELSTGNSWNLGQGFITFLGFSDDERQFAYHNSLEERLYLYDFDNQSSLSIAEPSRIEKAQFIDNELVYVTANRDAVFLNRWDGINFQQMVFERLVSSGTDYSIYAGFLRIVYYLHDAPSILSLINLNTGEMKTYELPSNIFPDWIPNSLSQFAYLEEDNSIWLYDVLSGSKEQLLENDPYDVYSYIGWSPDGQYLTIYRDYEGGTYFESIAPMFLEIATGELLHLRSSYSFNWGMRWLSATEITYNYSSPQHGEPFDIYYYNLATGSAYNLTNSPEIDETFDCFIG
jgi:hypothetical protein